MFPWDTQYPSGLLVTPSLQFQMMFIAQDSSPKLRKTSWRTGHWWMHSQFDSINILVLLQDLCCPTLKSEERRSHRVFGVFEVPWVNFAIPENGLREQFSHTCCVKSSRGESWKVFQAHCWVGTAGIKCNRQLQSWLLCSHCIAITCLPRASSFSSSEVMRQPGLCPCATVFSPAPHKPWWFVCL